MSIFPPGNWESLGKVRVGGGGPGAGRAPACRGAQGPPGVHSGDPEAGGSAPLSRPTHLQRKPHPRPARQHSPSSPRVREAHHHVCPKGEKRSSETVKRKKRTTDSREKGVRTDLNSSGGLHREISRSGEQSRGPKAGK